MSELIELLKSSFLFKDLSDPILAKVAERLSFEEYHPRETIFREGAEGDALFLIQKGAVEIRKRDQESGIEFHLNRLEAPSAFGEIALLKAAPRSASVVAIEGTRTAILKGDDFKNLALKLPEFAMAMAQSLAERVDELSKERRLTFSQLSQLDYDAKVMSMLPKKIMMAHQMVPLGYNGSFLSVAMVNPHNPDAMDELRRQAPGVMIEPVVVSEIDFKRFIESVYDRVTSGEAAAENKASSDITELMTSLDDDLRDLNSHDENSIVRLVQKMLIEANSQSASELHIEPRAESIQIRQRRNGILENLTTHPRKIQSALINRFKQMSHLDLEKTTPQAGTIALLENEREINFQVSTLPTRFGEKLVVKLPETGSVPALAKLVTSSQELQSISQLLTLPYGLILVIGPPGSGKTTTLYSILRQLTERNLSAYALGNHMAFDLPGINRIALDENKLSMKEAFQATLKQNPDVILLEELTDIDSFQMAIDTAMTGHLVISSFAAVDLESAIQRFEMMGGQKSNLFEALAGTITQRLLRRLCQSCRKSFTAEPMMLERLDLDQHSTLYRHQGCSVCEQTGYRGRLGLYEVLVNNSETRRLLKADAINEMYSKSFVSLRELGQEKLITGETTPQELIRALRL